MNVMVLLLGAQEGVGGGKEKLAMGWGRMQMVLVMVFPGHGFTGGGAFSNVTVYVPVSVKSKQMVSEPLTLNSFIPKLPDVKLNPVAGKIVQYLFVFVLHSESN